MKKTRDYDSYANINSALLYGLRQRPVLSRLGLGDTPPTLSIANLQTQVSNASDQVNNAGAADIVNAGLKVTSQLGLKPTNSTLNQVSSIAGQVAKVAVLLGQPEVAAVAGVVVTAALIVSAIVGDNSFNPTQQINQYNDQLRDQITTIDDQTGKVTQALQTLGIILKQNGFSGFGSSSILDNMKAGVAANAATPDLQAQLAQKIKNLQSLIQVFNATINETYSAVTGENTGRKFILFSLIGLALLGFGWYGYQALNDHE